MSVQQIFNSSIGKDVFHTAIGNWAGYIYQGLCGLYHVLTLLQKDREAYRGFVLSLDIYEDFAILDSEGLIVSLHQCKDSKYVQLVCNRSVNYT